VGYALIGAWGGMMLALLIGVVLMATIGRRALESAYPTVVCVFGVAAFLVGAVLLS
jgi:hypothetical protein